MMHALAFPGFTPDPGLAADIQLRVLSLGAGVQSTTLALMAAHGEIGPMPDCAIFADTGWEPRIPFEQTVSDLLDYWRRKMARRKRGD